MKEAAPRSILVAVQASWLFEFPHARVALYALALGGARPGLLGHGGERG